MDNYTLYKRRIGEYKSFSNKEKAQFYGAYKKLYSESDVARPEYVREKLDGPENWENRFRWKTQLAIGLCLGKLLNKEDIHLWKKELKVAYLRKAGHPFKTFRYQQDFLDHLEKYINKGYPIEGELEKSGQLMLFTNEEISSIVRLKKDAVIFEIDAMLTKFIYGLNKREEVMKISPVRIDFNSVEKPEYSPTYRYSSFIELGEVLKEETSKGISGEKDPFLSRRRIELQKEVLNFQAEVDVVFSEIRDVVDIIRNKDISTNTRGSYDVGDLRILIENDHASKSDFRFAVVKDVFIIVCSSLVLIAVFIVYIMNIDLLKFRNGSVQLKIPNFSKLLIFGCLALFGFAACWGFLRESFNNIRNGRNRKV